MKSLRILSLVKFSARYACLGMALAAAISAHAQTTYTYSGTAGGTFNWSAGANWAPSAPVSSLDTTISFTGVLAASDSYFSNNDLGNFLLNRLTIANTGTAPAGTLTLQGGTLEFVNSTAALSPTLLVNMGANPPAVAINNNILLTNNLSVTANNAFTIGGAISGGGNLIKSTGSTAALTLTAVNTYTGATTLGTAGSAATASVLTLSGANGSILNTSSITVNGSGSQLNLDYTGVAAGAVDRVANSMAVTLSTGGELRMNGTNTAATNSTETFGTLTLGTGTGTVSINNPSTGASSDTLTASGFSRGSNFATALVRGTSLGIGAIPNSRLILTSQAGLTQIGTSTSGTGVDTGSVKNLTIVPYLIGATGATGVGTNFVTYDTATGLRRLGTDEQSLVSVGATGDNVKSAVGANSVTGAQTFNSLLVGAGASSATPTTAATTVTGNGNSLTITSGALANVATAATGASTVTGFSSIIFGTTGANEAVITNTNVTAGGSLSIDSAIDTATAGGGLTKAGAGVVILSASNLYTGATTINQGALQIGNGTTGSLNASSIVTVTPQGTLSTNLANNGVMTNTIINNGTISKTVGANVNELSGGISGTGAVTVNLSGSVLAFSGAGTKTYSGATTVNDGALRAVGNVLSTASAINLTPNASPANATLQLRANTSTTFNSGAITLAFAGTTGRSVTLDVANFTSGTNQTLTMSSAVAITNSSGAGANTVNVSGANGYTLALGVVNTNTGSSGAPIIFNATTDFSISSLNVGQTNSVTTYVGSGNISLGTITNTVGSSRNTALNIGGSASNIFTGGSSGGPIFSSAGTAATLTGSVSLNGVTSVSGSNASNNAALVFNLNSGTLNVNNASALGDGLKAFVRNLNLAGGTIDATAGDINVTDSGTKLTTNINDNFSFGGTNDLNLGTGAVTLGNATTGAAGTTRTITTNLTTKALTIGGVISNGANATPTTGLTKEGTGTLILGGANAYTGQTTVNDGTLLVNNATGSGLGSGNAVVGIAGKLGGTGSFSGSVTVNTGGTLAPGASIQTLGSGTVSLNTGSTFAYEVDSGVALGVGADLQKVTGDLNLSGTVTLTFADLNATPTAFALGTTFTLINYSGSWNNGLFTYNAATVADGAIFNTGLNLWELDYNATTGGSNFSGEYAGANFVNITVVPEPSTFLLLAAGGMATLFFRRRRRA